MSSISLMPKRTEYIQVGRTVTDNYSLSPGGAINTQSSNSVENFVSKIENITEKIFFPLQKYLPLVGRFLLVATFIEDTCRIICQWGDQLEYLDEYRGYSHYFSLAFLLSNVVFMPLFSAMAISKYRTTLAGLGLLGVVAGQTVVYGLFTQLDFLMRDFSIVGGLLMLLSEEHGSSMRERQKKKGFWPGLPNIKNYTKEKSTWLSLFGRILLVFLFISLTFAGEMNPVRMVMSVVSIVVCLLVVLGFKAKLSAAIMLGVLSICNILLNNWWSLTHRSQTRDFLKFDFFQTLSVMGGLVLLINEGPGYLSLDEKKKEY